MFTKVKQAPKDDPASKDRDVRKRMPQGGPHVNLGKVGVPDETFIQQLHDHVALLNPPQKGMGKAVPLYDAGGEAGGGQTSGSGETASEGSALDAVASLGAGTGDESGETKSPQNWATKEINAMSKSKSPAYFANVPTGNHYVAPDWHVNLYDEGGEMNTNNAPIMDRGAKIFVMGRADGGNGSKVNLYDEGGEAGTDANGHQLAVIENGERVLTPDETAQYDQEHPREAAAHAQPQELAELSMPQPITSGATDRPTPTSPATIALDGEKYNAQLSDSAVKNVNKYITPPPPVGSYKNKLGQVVTPEMVGNEAPASITSPMGSVRQMPAEPPKEAMPQAPDPRLAILQDAKENAATKGNLVNLGSALIGEKALAPLPTVAKVTTPQDFKDRIQSYKDRYQAALDKGTPEGQQEAAAIKQAQLNFEKDHPWGSAVNHPGLLGKIGHVASEVGQFAGEQLGGAPVLAQIPGTMLNRKAEENRAMGMGKVAAEEAQQTAETAEKKAQTKQLAQGKWEPMAGEQYTAYATNPDGSQGAPIAQLWRNANNPSQVEWRNLPSLTGGQPTVAAGGTPAATGGAPSGVQFGTKEAVKPNDRLLDDAGIARMNAQVQQAGTRLPAGYDAVPPVFDKTDTGASAKAKYDQYVKNVQDQIAAKKVADAELNRDRVAEAKADAKVKRDQQKNEGYVQMKDSTQVTRTNEYDARNNPQYNGSTFEAMKPGDEAKDKQAMKMLNDVQLNTSRYTNAATDYSAAQSNGKFTRDGKPISKDNPIPVSGWGELIGFPSHVTDQKEVAEQDRKNIAAILTQAGWADINASISQGGHIELPVVSAFGQSLSRQMKSKYFNELSDQGKQLMISFRSQLGAIPAYQQALAKVSRQNREVLDLELANIIDPTNMPNDILLGQKRFQENINQAASGFPDNYPGVPTPAATRENLEGKRGGKSTTQLEEIPTDVKGLLNNFNKPTNTTKPSAATGRKYSANNPFAQ